MTEVNKDWHVSYDNKRFGPLSLEEVKQHLTASPVGMSTLVWKQGSSEWHKAMEIPELRTNGSTPPPPPATFLLKGGEKIYAISIMLLPLIGAIIEVGFAISVAKNEFQALAIIENRSWTLLWLLLYGFLAYRDAKFLETFGVRVGRQYLFALLLPFIYLILRAREINRLYGLPFLKLHWVTIGWLVCSIVSASAVFGITKD